MAQLAKFVLYRHWSLFTHVRKPGVCHGSVSLSLEWESQDLQELRRQFSSVAHIDQESDLEQFTLGTNKHSTIWTKVSW